MSVDQRSSADRLMKRAVRAFQRLTGNRVGSAGVRDFERGLERVHVELGMSGPEAVVDALEEGRTGPAVALARSLSVPESYFMREPGSWQVLEELAITELTRRKRPLRAWSVGCARGEEPETLRLLAHRDLAAHEPMQILATDMDERLLEEARRGVYRRWSLRALPQFMRSHFDEVEEGFLLRRDRACCHVEYRRHLLMLEPLPDPWCVAGGLDLILCRNLLIYFHRRAIEGAFELFHELLRPGGILLLASTDPWPREGSWRRTDRKAPLFVRQADDTQAKTSRASDDERSSLLSRTLPGGTRGPQRVAPSRDTPRPRVVEEEEWVPPVVATATEPDGLLLARFHLERGAPGEALSVLERELAGEELRADLRYLCGEVLLGLGRTQEAERSFRKALFLERRHAAAALGLHRCFLRRGDSLHADRYLRLTRRLAEELDPEELAGSGADVAACELRRCLDEPDDGQDS